MGHAPSLDVSVGLGKTGVDDATLSGRVFVVRRWGLGPYSDHTAGDPKFQVLVVLVPSQPSDGRRHYERSSDPVFNDDAHD